jgi:hypothetical protein
LPQPGIPGIVRLLVRTGAVLCAQERRERLPAVELVGDEGPCVVPGDRLDRQRVVALGEEVAEQPDASV